MNLNELKAKLKTIAAALAVLAALDAPTPEQIAEFNAKHAEAERLKAQIDRIEAAEGLRAHVERVEPVARPAPAPAPAASRSARPTLVIENPGFASLGELVYCARFQSGDSRVRALQEMQTGDSGGIMVPDELNPILREVSPQEAIFRGRASVIPAGESPDAAVTMPSLDQSSNENMFGGVEVTWTGEGSDTGETGAKLKDVTWTPFQVSGHIVVTDKLLRNWRSAGPFLDTQLRRAILAAEDYAFLRGSGVGRPLGVLSSGCLLTVNRATANTVKYEDLVDMESKILEDLPAVWIVTAKAIKQLRLMKDGANQYIWSENARDPAGATLLGRPVVKNYRSPAVGSKGDVILATMPHYVIKDGSPLSVAASEHVHFKNLKTVVRASKSVGGGPWMKDPITQEDGQTYSPFVALDVPA